MNILKPLLDLFDPHSDLGRGAKGEAFICPKHGEQNVTLYVCGIRACVYCEGDRLKAEKSARVHPKLN